MATALNIIERIQDMIIDSSTETKGEILKHLNAAYFEIAAEHPWHLLTEQVTQSTAVLPADLERIIYVEDDTDYLYFNIGFPQRYSSERLYNYFDDIVYATPLLSGSDLVTTANSTTVTSATGGFTAAMIGEYIRVGSNRGIYKIAGCSDTNTITLQDGFRGASSTAQYFEVRPKGTRKIALTNEQGGAITSTTLKLWYLKKPLPLYNDYDQIMLPSECDALRIKVLQIMMVGDKYDNDALKQIPNYDDALDKMKSLNPYPKRFKTPRDFMGNRFAFGRQRVTRGVHPYREA